MQEFDHIYDKEITKRYGKHENKRLSKRRIESELWAQVDHSNGMLEADLLMLLVYYRLYI